MKKVILSIGIVASLFASDKLLTKKELNNVLKSSIIYPKLSQDIKKGIVKVRGVFKDGFYIINIKTPRGAGNIYITKDKKYTILGNIINNKNGSPLTSNLDTSTINSTLTMMEIEGKIKNLGNMYYIKN